MLIVNLQVDKSKINPYISNTLLEKIDQSIEKGKKTILYLNKRGDFSSLICKDCSKIYKCKNCDISLSVHKYPEKLLCHLCSDNSKIPLKCDKCHGANLVKIGIGTQQIESSLQKYFKDKDVNIFRFDTDNIKKISDKKKALENLEKADIIIGTKMITTGFNLKNIAIIGIILLEQELSIPKYDVEEKVYSNMKQLIGRGNRVGEKTENIIQTFIPENEMIKNISEDNYKDFFKKTLKERKLFNYPPFTEMVTIEYRDKSEQKAKDFINKIKNKLDIENSKDNLVEEIKLVPNYTRKYNNYYYKIIIKTLASNEINGKEKSRLFLETIKTEIMRNRELVVIFE